MEYYSAIEKKQLLTHATTETSLKTIVPRERVRYKKPCTEESIYMKL